ncbi:hypothetical protein TCAL_01070 [Tigriopus californicus]|uniref:Uncharacterized protein n=1 Tax=Tigriopus californicus TaxID=6832 RepID=A0A553P2C1_TIGCA|nr:hypothetical protein TCAL_01070 [Tigriopus californicus]
MCFQQDLRARIQEADQRPASLRRKAKEHHDARAKEFPSLQVGDIDLIRNPGTKIWDFLREIVERVLQRWSYMLRTESGRLKWRNRKFLRRVQQDDRVPEPGTNTDPTPENRSSKIGERTSGRIRGGSNDKVQTPPIPANPHTVWALRPIPEMAMNGRGMEECLGTLT